MYGILDCPVEIGGVMCEKQLVLPNARVGVPVVNGKGGGGGRWDTLTFGITSGKAVPESMMNIIDEAKSVGVIAEVVGMLPTVEGAYTQWYADMVRYAYQTYKDEYVPISKDREWVAYKDVKIPAGYILPSLGETGCDWSSVEKEIISFVKEKKLYPYKLRDKAKRLGVSVEEVLEVFSYEEIMA